MWSHGDKQADNKRNLQASGQIEIEVLFHGHASEHSFGIRKVFKYLPDKQRPDYGSGYSKFTDYLAIDIMWLHGMAMVISSGQSKTARTNTKRVSEPDKVDAMMQSWKSTMGLVHVNPM